MKPYRRNQHCKLQVLKYTQNEHRSLCVGEGQKWAGQWERCNCSDFEEFFYVWNVRLLLFIWCIPSQLLVFWNLRHGRRAVLTRAHYREKLWYHATVFITFLLFFMVWSHFYTVLELSSLEEFEYKLMHLSNFTPSIKSMTGFQEWRNPALIWRTRSE